MSRILGVDPGLRCTGYGLLAEMGSGIPRLLEAGVIRLDAAASVESRLRTLGDELEGLLGKAAPDRVAVEKLYAHYRHPRTAILMGHARGVILFCAARRGLAVQHLPSTEVKKAVTGKGHASKGQIQSAVAAHFNLAEPPEPPDVADAIAVAFCAAARSAWAEP